MRKILFLVASLIFFISAAFSADKKTPSVTQKSSCEACENFLNDYSFAKYIKATIVDGAFTKTMYVRAGDIKGFSVQADGLGIIFSKDAVEDAREIAYVPYAACKVFEYRTGVLVLSVDASKL